MRSLSEISLPTGRPPVPNETVSRGKGQHDDTPVSVSSTEDPSRRSSTVRIPASSTSTNPPPYPATVSPSPFPSPSQAANASDPIQIKQEYDFPVDNTTDIFARSTGSPQSPKTIDNNFSNDVDYPPSFIAHPTSVTKKPAVYINPSILLTNQRANCSGPGTPMPCLSPTAYRYPYWEHSSNKTPSRHRQRSRRRQKIEKNETSKRAPTLVKTTAKDDKINLLKNVKHLDFYAHEIDNNLGRRCRDARDWLNERAAKGMNSNKIPRFVDRATSPINLGTEGLLRPKSREVALSPIRCIQPLRSCESSVNEKTSGTKLSGKRSSVVGENSIKFEMIKLLKHSCERCEVEVHGEETMGCPTCQAQAMRNVVY